MKRLLIHLGYPKAASTTLQNGLFYELHKSNVINFVARAMESGYFGSAQNKKEYKAWFRSVLQGRNVAETSNINEGIILNFSDKRLNVLSEGYFLTNEKHDSLFTIPEKVNDYFKDKVDKIELLFVLRNQQTLIMSDYVQTYCKIKEKSFLEYLNNRITSKKKKKFKIFYPYNLIRRYSEVIGKENIHIVFFEDLINDKETFSSELGAILGVRDDLVGKLLESAYFNRTPKEEQGSVVRKLGPLSFGGRLRRIFDRIRLLMGGSIAPDRRILVPNITDDEKLLIFNTFKDSNSKLAEEFGLDKERMKKYGYI